MLAFLVVALSLQTPNCQPDYEHVRTTNSRIRRLIVEGRRRSPTFDQLIASLDRSDVIVHIGPTFGRQRFAGYLVHHVVATADNRYLWIYIRTQGTEGAIGTLGHELQHAIEVARAPDVRDDGAIEKLFDQIQCFCGVHETLEARSTERAVRKELVKSRGADRDE